MAINKSEEFPGGVAGELADLNARVASMGYVLDEILELLQEDRKERKKGGVPPVIVNNDGGMVFTLPKENVEKIRSLAEKVMKEKGFASGGAV